MKFFSVGFLFLIVVHVANAQFDYARYEPVSIQKALTTHKSLIDPKVDCNLSGIDFPYKAVVKFGDSVRVIAPDVNKVIQNWLKSAAKVNVPDTLFRYESLFYEKGKAYWIPTQAPLLKPLKSEIRRRGTVQIYFTVIGATKKRVVMILNEFQKQ